MENFGRKKKISFKGRIDLVTETDKKSEEYIVRRISKEFPNHAVLAEESGMRQAGSENLWIIDPLDGTTNYAHGFGFFAVSIALRCKKSIAVAVVYAPYLNECYTAVAGHGAFLNGMRINVSETEDLERSMVATGFPYDIKETRDNIGYFEKFLVRTQAVRRPGSAAIDLCCVAAGKFDGFWELKLNPWDTAAGVLIIREAGGVVTDLSGGEYDPFMKEILASNGRIHDKMIEVIKR